jgi:hypothetical protein
MCLCVVSSATSKYSNSSALIPWVESVELRTCIRICTHDGKAVSFIVRICGSCYLSLTNIQIHEYAWIHIYIYQAFCTCQSLPLSSLADSVDLDSEDGRTHLMSQWEHVVGPLANIQGGHNSGGHDAVTTSTILKTPKQSTDARGSSSYGDQVDDLKISKLGLE